MPGLTALLAVLLQLPAFVNPDTYVVRLYEPIVTVIAEHSALDPLAVPTLIERIKRVILPSDVEAFLKYGVNAVKNSAINPTTHALVINTEELRSVMIARIPDFIDRMPLCTELSALQSAAFPWCMPPATPEVSPEKIKEHFTDFVENEMPSSIDVQGVDPKMLEQFRGVTSLSNIVIGVILFFCFMLYLMHWLFLGTTRKALYSTGIVIAVTGLLIGGAYLALQQMLLHLDRWQLVSPFQQQVLASVIENPLPTYRLISFAFVSLGLLFVALCYILSRYDSEKTSH